jgi:hypothetical protein
MMNNNTKCRVINSPSSRRWQVPGAPRESAACEECSEPIFPLQTDRAVRVGRTRGVNLDRGLQGKRDLTRGKADNTQERERPKDTFRGENGCFSDNNTFLDPDGPFVHHTASVSLT